MPASIRRLVPLDNENRWSDLLAVLIETGAVAATEALGLTEASGRAVTVTREVRAGGGADRVDLVVHVDGALAAVIEAKDLPGPGARQLERYSASYPQAQAYLVLAPARLPIHAGPAAGEGWF